MNVADEVAVALRSWGAAPVCIDLTRSRGEAELSAPYLLRRIDELSESFSAYGIAPGDRVVLALSNSADFVVALVALSRIGAVSSPIKRAYGSVELDEIFRNLEPAAVIVEQDDEARFGSFAAKSAVIVRDSGAFRLSREAARTERAAAPEGRVASINYTYRGSGYPIGAMIPHDGYTEGARIFAEGMAGRVSRRMLVILPMSHIFTLVGCVFAPLLSGMSLVIADTGHPRKLLELCDAYGVDFITAVPELFDLLATYAGKLERVPRFDIFASGGSHMSAASYRRIRETFDVELLHGYGLTECAPVSRNVRGSARPGSSGPVGEGIECRVLEPQADGVGEIALRCSHMALGYYRRPEETAAAFRDGWFRTGDLGKIEDDHLYFSRELKGTCKVNGTMVDLSEVERVMLEAEGVEGVRVGLVNGRLTASVSGRTLSPDRECIKAIRDNIKGVMADYKLPNIVIE